MKRSIMAAGLSVAAFCMAAWSASGADSDQKASTQSRNKEAVQAYMEGFRRSDHAAILACLTEDVEWFIPGAFHLKGKAAFDKEIENPAFVGSPIIHVNRLIEEGQVVVAEGRVRGARKGGGFLYALFCDVFEMQDGKIRRLTSYLMEVKEGDPTSR